MAATTRAITPTHTGPFSSANPGPHTPTSIASSSLNPSAIAGDNSRFRQSPSPISPKQALTPRFSPQPPTGASAMADERRRREQEARESSRQTSPNPAASAINALLGGSQSNMSKARDAPSATTTMAEPLAKVTNTITIPETVTNDAMQTSPVSLSSFGSADNNMTTAPTATTSEPATAGPLNAGTMPASEGANHHTPTAGASGGGEMSASSNRAFTFPVPAPPDSDPRAPTRGMSLPMSGYHNSPKSPSAKRHKCPYCSTDFTRHHNLKSHLLTHSQEKPYECTTCQARFRRLHDLKRHTKLHTGERPHTCPKCGRRFARGDALARHNKGQGGCAGRRSSFGMDDDMGEERAGDESMDGVVYQRGDHDEERMDEDEPHLDGPRRVSEPSRKASRGSTQYQQHPSTYPPPRGQLMSNNIRPMYPPGASGSSSSRDHPHSIQPKGAESLSTVHLSNQSVFSQGGMTESPKPLSPGQIEAQHRMSLSEGTSHPGNRQGSLSQQIHQQQFGRGAGRGSSPMGLPPPAGTSGVQLPSISGNFRPSDSRMSISSASGGPQHKGSVPGPSMLHQQVAPPGTASNTSGSLSGHTQPSGSSGGSLREIFGGREVDLWDYIRTLESRFTQSQEQYESKFVRMQDQINLLKSQLQQAHQQQHAQQPGR